jgi:hypothetical protein
MNPLLDELLQAARQPAGLDTRLKTHAARLTPELATEARAVALQALQEQRGGAAMVAYYLAALINLRLGRREPALVSYLDYHQVRFMAANTLEAYAAVEHDAQEVARLAGQIGAHTLRGRGLVLAADAAYWAAEVAPPKDQDAKITSGLVLLATAASEAHIELEGTWYDRTISLLAALIAKVRGSVFLQVQDSEAAEPLRRLAAWAEAHVPVEYTVPGDSAKTNVVARELAWLSSHHGA